MGQLTLMMWNIKQVSLNAMSKDFNIEKILNERVAQIVEMIVNQGASIVGIVEVRPGQSDGKGNFEGAMVPWHIAQQVSSLTGREWLAESALVCKGSYAELNSFIYDSSAVSLKSAEVLDDFTLPFEERRPFLGWFVENTSQQPIPFCIIHFPAPDRKKAIAATSKSLSLALANVQLKSTGKFVLAGDFNVNYEDDPTFFSDLGKSLGNLAPLVGEKSTVGKVSKTTVTNEKSAYDNAFVAGFKAMAWIYNYVHFMKLDTGFQKGYDTTNLFEKSMLSVSDHLPVVIHLEW